MRYGIINAMAEEKAALVAAMTDEKQTTIAGKLFHHGKIGNVDVCLLYTSDAADEIGAV